MKPIIYRCIFILQSVLHSQNQVTKVSQFRSKRKRNVISKRKLCRLIIVFKDIQVDSRIKEISWK